VLLTKRRGPGGGWGMLQNRDVQKNGATKKKATRGGCLQKTERHGGRPGRKKKGSVVRADTALERLPKEAQTSRHGVTAG